MTRTATRTAVRPASLAMAVGTALATVLALSACTPADDTAGPASGVSPTPARVADGTGAADVAAPALAPDAATLPAHPVAVTDGPVAVHSAPDAGSSAVELPAETTFGSRRTLRILEADTAGDWLKVVVPARGDTGEGWVRASDVQVEAVRHHIAVDLDDRTLVLSEGGEPVLTATVAVGSPDNPTPTGRFFVTDKLEGGGAYGPYAFGISAWSSTLSEFAGGDGQIGLHGTDEPDLLGQAVSHGCIRLPNDVVTELAGILPLGVPVDIRA